MTVILRADAGPTMGTGHVMRSAALGLRMRRLGHDVSLVTASLPDSVRAWLSTCDIEVITLPPGAETEDGEELSAVTRTLGPGDWVVVDHYERDESWELQLDRGGARLCVIDDLADRRHDCDALIDVGMHALVGSPYRNLVPADAELLLGPSFALLRPEFEGMIPRKRTGEISRILVSLGGGDLVADELLKVLAALARLPAPRPEVRILRDAALSSMIDPAAASIPGVTCLDFTKDMPGMLMWADLVMGTCGGSSWERCLLGVPTIVCLTAENQRGDVDGLSAAGAVLCVGDAHGTTAGDWAHALSTLMAHPETVRAVGVAAAGIMTDRDRSLKRLDGLLAPLD